MMSVAASYLNPWAWKDWWQGTPAAEAVELTDRQPTEEPKYTPVYSSVPTVSVTLPREEIPCCSVRSALRVGMMVVGTAGMMGCIVGAAYYGSQLDKHSTDRHQQGTLTDRFLYCVGGAILSPIAGCLTSLCLRSDAETQTDHCATNTAVGCLECCATTSRCLC